MTENKSFEKFMEQMWVDYIKMTPQAAKITELLTKTNEVVTNDHIALRTFNHPRIGLMTLAKSFLNFGYVSAGEYRFPKKKLFARHFEHPNKTFPKIFISEFELENLSVDNQKAIHEAIDQLSNSTIESENFVFSGKTWKSTYSTYQKLRAESEYAAWVYAYGFRPNHFTVNVNALKKFSNLSELNAYLKENNFKLNTFGGEIKGSAEELLEQSSTMADEIAVTFSEGTYSIPGCYYEFAKRYPMSNGELYQGFIAKSADKIFESTNKT